MIYLSSIGKNGITKIVDLSINKTQFLISEIEKINGFSIPFKNNILFEFLLKTNYSISKIIKNAIINNIFLNKIEYKNETYLIVAVTEKRTKKELMTLIDFFKNYSE